MSLSHPAFEFHPSRPYLIIDLGTLTTERDGLQSLTCIYKTQRSDWAKLPKRKSKHSIFTHLSVDRVEVNFSGVFAVATCTYFGIETPETDSVYDISDNTSEEPISTHPDFTTLIGGTPMEPLNGAVFRRAGMAGESAYVDGTEDHKATSNKGYVFDRFHLLEADNKTQNRFAKVESYLEPGITYRRSWCRRQPVTDLSAIGKIQTPMGSPPELPAGRNWLCISFTQQIKGAAVQCTQEWRSSGRRGWIEEIYGLNNEKGLGGGQELGGAEESGEEAIE